MKFEYLDHTADAKFKAYGKTLEEAFIHAAEALFTLVTDISKVKAVQEHEIHITANKKESLLYDFMEELIVLMDTEGFVLSKVTELKIQSGENWMLNATVVGDSADHYEIITHIKAPTYSDMIIEEKEQVMIQFVPDI